MSHPDIRLEETWTFEIEDLPIIAEQLIARYNRYSVWLFEGQLGAGKTTLIQAICKKMEIKDAVLSPTFSIVNAYQDKNDRPVYHIDLYRLSKLEDAWEIGLFEIEESGYFCFIEWASAIGYRPQVPHILASLHILSDTKRQLTISVHEN